MTAVTEGESVFGPALFCGAVVAVSSYLIGPKRGDIRVDIALASIASFLFGILMAFTIVRTRERLALVQDLVSKGNASLLAIHSLMEVFPGAERSSVRELIDRQLTDQIDYRLVDNFLSSSSHLALINAVIALEPRTRQEEVVYKEAVEICIDMGSNRALIEAASGQALSAIEWSGLLLLLLLLMGLIAVLPGGTLWGALVAGLMAGTLVTLIVLLRKLDRLRWHERTSIWEPTARLFRSMGRDPVRAPRSHRFRPLPTHRPDPGGRLRRSLSQQESEARHGEGFDPVGGSTVRRVPSARGVPMVPGLPGVPTVPGIPRVPTVPGAPMVAAARSVSKHGKRAGLRAAPGTEGDQDGPLVDPLRPHYSAVLSKRLRWAGWAAVLPLRGRQHGT